MTIDFNKLIIFKPTPRRIGNWRGGISYTKEGYETINVTKVHPFRSKRGYVATHRLKMEEHLTKLNGILTFINPNLDVHHIDRNIHNNDISNLMIIKRSDHARIHRPKKDYSGVYCLICNSKETYVIKRLGDNLNHNRPKWVRYKNGYCCENCHRKIKYDKLKPDTDLQYSSKHNRICCVCQSNKTHVNNKTKYEAWFIFIDGNTENFVCNICYKRFIYHS